MGTPDGTVEAPLMLDTLYSEFASPWMMWTDDRSALLALLAERRPKYAIEIGTKDGGSLSAIAKYSERVSTIDIDPNCATQLAGRFPNVDFITGSSVDELPPLLSRLEAEKVPLGFVLIDGDHTRRGVAQDITSILQYRPIEPLYITMHDSFMPKCRNGMLDADWAASPYVHYVELDFGTGHYDTNPSAPNSGFMGGGIGFAMMLPEPRKHELVVSTHEQRLYDTIRADSDRRTGRDGGCLKRFLRRVRRKLTSQ